MTVSGPGPSRNCVRVSRAGVLRVLHDINRQDMVSGGWKSFSEYKSDGKLMV
jgi:hypothetical protein